MENYYRAGKDTCAGIIRHMRVTCWKTKPTDNTLRMCNNYWLTTVTMATGMPFNVTFICTLPVLFYLELSTPENC